jgi:uncharacterized LabA/DUF88 family protein
LTSPQVVRANVYVDGFNLYFGLLKGNAGCKWLDLRALATRAFPAYAVGRVRYFTAKVEAPPRDPDMAQRQQTYLDALRTQHDLKIHFGHFNKKIVKGSLLDAQDEPTWVMERVRTMEEKGSDVNLAAYLLLDAFGRHYDAAVVVSNDSDLETPIRRVQQILGVSVDILNPTSRASDILRRVARSYASITLADAQVCQLPANVKAANGGTIRRPPGW